MTYKIAVVGATGTVGREVLSILEERKFPTSKVVALASESSIGKEVSYGEKEILKVEPLALYDFSGTDFAFFCAGSEVARQYAPKAAAAGTIVIDHSSRFRLEPGVPLIVPEVNGHVLDKGFKKNIIANANCIAIPLT
ncbi:MAG: aspartate-semialdehyde dehydrogenase, partial [Alphaproteobacteria bacterium]|nr:aspartate-semialdehyde dehydrogenase [Alphaproteobacteria bacterium]